MDYLPNNIQLLMIAFSDYELFFYHKLLLLISEISLGYDFPPITLLSILLDNNHPSNQAVLSGNLEEEKS